MQHEKAQGRYSYRDVWGLHHVLDEVLQRISDAPTLESSESLSLSYRLN
ncbi:Hypothetical protein AA314_07860 [Archangium gephyra]|uniref:Uncharacterized protein n=1 Tax=Archangium gephyra TaxID=48 RepID=A0AAC8QF35_9BACT|nr:Hypothetical protein AA314_07860 [Archangium gephyra]